MGTYMIIYIKKIASNKDFTKLFCIVYVKSFQKSQMNVDFYQ